MLKIPRVVKTAFIVTAVCVAVAISFPAKTVVPSVPSPDITNSSLVPFQTLNRHVLVQFIQSRNGKVYDRLANEIVDAAIKYSRKYRLSVLLVLSVIPTESEFSVSAESKKGARGLMQINPVTWYDLLLKKGIVNNKADLYDPDRNIEAGCFVLRTYMDESKSFEMALNKYLGGAGSAVYRADVEKSLGSILIFGVSQEIDMPYKAK